MKSARTFQQSDAMTTKSSRPIRRSNCLAVALAAWWRDPHGVRIHVIRSDFGGPHVFWTDRSGRSWHWRSTDKALPLWRLLRFEGQVARYLPR